MAVGFELSISDLPVYRDREFGGIYIGVTIADFDALGFVYGDTVDIRFSNGAELRGVPYYNGYYGRVGSPILVAYPGNKFIKAALNFGDSLWEAVGVNGDDTASVSLAEAGVCRALQESFDITYTNDRASFGSDEAFANFRALVGGRLRPDFVYRSASPIDDEYARAAYASKLMTQAGVRFVLDLSESPRKMLAYMEDARQRGIDVSLFSQLVDRDAVAAIALMANYPSPDFARKLAEGFRVMSAHEGPYLLHCVEGKDRTGFVCLVLEALAHATYDQMRADYMATYANYYGITEQCDPAKYRAIVEQNLHGMLGCLLRAESGEALGGGGAMSKRHRSQCSESGASRVGCVDDDGAGEGACVSDGGDEKGACVGGCAGEKAFRSRDYAQAARAYLRIGGMTDFELDVLYARICRGA